MPTGYTSKIYNGEQVTGKEFIMTCARAFGALSSMRDESNDTPIPEELKLDTHYKDELDKAKQKLKEFQSMTKEEIQILIDKNYLETIEANNKYHNENLALRKRYENVIAEVEKWEPPSSDHYSLKNYAIEQLKDSIRYDCNSDNHSKGIKKENPDEYIQKQIDSCLWDIDYYQKEWDKEVKRNSERNLWIKQLRDSF